MPSKPTCYRYSFILLITKFFILAETVTVKCSQTGDEFLAKLEELYTVDGDEISKKDIFPGLDVLVDIDGSPYPAAVVGLQGK